MGYNRLTPYVYSGFGYERVDNEYNGYKSQGFFDAGMGLKYHITDKVNLLADIQGIKKFKDNDLDILASLGLGFFFGANTQSIPETTAPVVHVRPSVPTNREITIVKVKQAPRATYRHDTRVMPTHRGNYYLQLAAAFKSDLESGCHFTDELKQEGIDYEIKYATINGKNASLLVVGPYSSKEEAREDLAKIRKISKNAFIRRLP